MVTRPNDPVFDNIPALKKRTEKYFRSCLDDMIKPENVVTLKNGERRTYGKRPSVIGYCLYIGIDKNTFYRYLYSTDTIGGLSEDAMNEIRSIFSHVREMVEELLVQESMNGMIDSRIGAMFLAQHGYSVKQEIDATTTIRFEGMSKDEAEQYSR